MILFCFIFLCISASSWEERNEHLSDKAKMSQQQQTVRITTTSTSTSSTLVINTGYLKTWPGLLKLAQFVNILKPVDLASMDWIEYFFLFHFHLLAPDDRFDHYFFLSILLTHSSPFVRSWDAYVLASLPIILMTDADRHRLNYSSTWWPSHSWSVRRFCWFRAYSHGAPAASYRKPFT